MRDRLSSLSDEARTIRAQVPSEFEPDVARIQHQMQHLGERLSQLSGGAHSAAAGRSAAKFADPNARRADPNEVILLGSARSGDNPWDEETANALTRFYESGQASFSDPKPAEPAEPQQDQQMLEAHPNDHAGSSQEPAWLDQRFADIAKLIEQSLAEMRPESSLLTIGRRFDQLEARMTSVLGGLATRADVQELRIAEAQIEEISAQLDQLRRQLARLDAIDAHLGTLSAQLSDDRLGRADSDAIGRLAAIDQQLQTIAVQLSHDRLTDIISESIGRGADLEGLATTAADKTAARLADSDVSNAQSRDIGEVRGLLESLINERRHNDENNASMLETMQQAIIRVLDRIDALELAHHVTGSASTPETPAEETPAEEVPDEETAPPADYDEPEHQPMQTQRDQDYEAPHMGLFARERDEQASPRNEEPYVTAPFDLDAAFAPEPDADADRYAGSALSPKAADALRYDFIADAHRAKLKAASRTDNSAEYGRAGELAADERMHPASDKQRKRRSFIRSPRVLMGILMLLAMIPAALFFMPRTATNGAVIPTAKNVAPLHDDGATGSNGTDTGGNDTGGVAPISPGGGPDDSMPRKQSQQLGPDMVPAPGHFQDAGKSSADADDGRVDTASLPTGIALGSSAEATAQHLAQNQEFQPGAPGVQPTPAALMQDHVLRLNGAASDDDNKTLSMPPATVGPFSLRMAAAQGEPSAQFEVAARLAEGKGDTDQNLKEAVAWYQRSASSGFAMAQFRLGTLYERGVGVKTDLARAQVWYSRAAEQGNIKAMHNLAVLIAAGRPGSKPDYETAAKWFTEAADRGLADSQYNLAVLYESGLGVPLDLKEAYKWLLLASASGDKELKSRREALDAKISPKDRAAAEAIVSTWRSKGTNSLTNDFRAAGQAWRRQPQQATRG